VVQKTCQVHFSYLLWLGNFCKGPRTLQKFPQKCQKIAGCWGRAVYVHNLRLPRHLAHPFRNDPVQTTVRVNHGLTQRAPVHNTATSTLSCLFQQEERDKAEVSTSRGGTGARCIRPWLTRGSVSDPVVPERMSLVSKRSEVVHINGAPSTPGYLLALLWELSQAPRGLTENAEAKQVRKPNQSGIINRLILKVGLTNS